MSKVKIAVLVSGGGTNLQALIDAERDGIIYSGEIAAVISDNPGAYALERARAVGIAAVCVDRKACADRTDFEAKLSAAIDSAGASVIVLAGFMRILSADFTAKYPERMINIHPSLIPSFCGEGFYGLHVHEAALAYGVKVTGATVHFVNEVPDGGRIIMQRAVDIADGDTPETLQRRVMEQAEWIILPLSVEKVCADMAASK